MQEEEYDRLVGKTPLQEEKYVELVGNNFSRVTR